MGAMPQSSSTRRSVLAKRARTLATSRQHERPRARAAAAASAGTERNSPLGTRLVAEVAGEVGIADTGGPGDEDVLMLAHPLAAGEAADECLVDSAVRPDAAPSLRALALSRAAAALAREPTRAGDRLGSIREVVVRPWQTARP